MEKEFFSVNVSAYVPTKNFCVERPASLDNPKDNSVIFVSDGECQKAVESLEKVKECLVFCPDSFEFSSSLEEKHAFVKSENARLSYCRFFKENSISYYLPKDENIKCVDGAFISENAKIGEGSVIMPYAYISGGVTLGKNVYIGVGTKIIGNVTIGDNVSIRENTVIGSDSLTLDRDETGLGIAPPQFGGVTIGNNVRIASGSTVDRGDIDDTVICEGVRIGDMNFVGGNVYIGENSLITTCVALFSGVKIGKNCLISGNSTIRENLTVGDNCIVGMGGVVVKSVPANSVVKGNPAK
ncbi:MAG: hypothetical protein IJF80_00955 [Clostridia bacterium]|nr:hypothetical protein [Clostridia bacterium]